MSPLKNNKPEEIRHSLRPELKAALDAVEHAAHDTVNLDGEDDHALAVLAVTYDALGRNDDSKRCFDEAITYVERNGSSSFPFTVLCLSRSGRRAEADRLVAKWLTSAESTNDKNRAGLLSDIITAAMLSERQEWLLRVEELLPREMEYLDPTLQSLSNAWGSLRNYRAACAMIDRIGSSSSKANAWARLACTLAYAEQEKEARHALQNAKKYVPILSEPVAADDALAHMRRFHSPDQSDIQREHLRYQIVEAHLALGEITIAQNLVEEAQLSEVYFRLYNQHLSRELAKKAKFNEAIGTAEKIISKEAYFDISSIQSRLLTMASIGLSMAKAGHTIDARILLTEVLHEAKHLKPAHYAFLKVAEALAESGFTNEAISAYAQLYEACVNVGQPRDWVVTVARAIANQVKAGLAYEEVAHHIPCDA